MDIQRMVIESKLVSFGFVCKKLVKYIKMHAVQYDELK